MKISKILIMLLSALFLGGCFEPKYQAKSDESSKASYEKILERIPKEERERFDNLIVLYFTPYEYGGDLITNSRKSIDGMTAKEIYERIISHEELINNLIEQEARILKQAEIARARMKPPIEIRTYDRVNQIWGIPYAEVRVIAVDDEVTVFNVVVNRGNCPVEKVAEAMNMGKTFPRVLKFGESESFTFGNQCSAKQVDVETDQGTWTVSY